MRHYFNFVMWCLRKFSHWLITYPNHLFTFYKEALREETVMTLVFSTVGWFLAMLLTALMASYRNADNNVVMDANSAVLWIFGFTVFFPPSFFVFTLIGMLHDRYCAELQDTMNRLKARK